MSSMPLEVTAVYEAAMNVDHVPRIDGWLRAGGTAAIGVVCACVCTLLKRTACVYIVARV